MPAAHTTLWFMGVFLFLWGLTLVVRGLPPGLAQGLMRLAKRDLDEAQRGRAGSWVLALGGVVAMVLGGVAVALGVSVYEWVYGGRDGQFASPLWGSTALAVAAFSLTLLVWAVRGERTRRRRCPMCQYSMEGVGSLCPECGFAAAEERDFFRPRRRRRLAVFAVTVLVFSPSLLLVPRYQQWGVPGFVPTTVMIGGFERLPEAWIQWSWPNHGSLAERRQNDQLWAWQERWLLRRTMRLMVSERSSPQVVVRAMNVTGHQVPPELEAQYVSRLIELLCNPSQEVRDSVAAGLYIPWTLRACKRDHAEVIAPHAERLRALLGDPTGEVALAAAALLVAGSVHADEALRAVVLHAQPRGFVARHASTVVELAIQKAGTKETRMAFYSHEDPALRRLAASAGPWSQELDAETEAVLTGMLDDADVTVAQSAASRLHSARHDGAVELIVRAAAPRPKNERGYMLHVLTNSTFDLGLIAGLAKVDEPALQIAALEAIEILHTDGRDVWETLDTLREAAEAAHPDVAKEAQAIIDVITGRNAAGEDP